MADLLDRVRQLVAAGPYDARPAEVAAVHAALYPERDAVCQTCRGELGKAYYAIQRWASQQASSSTLSSSIVKKTTTARFKSDTTIYTPHGLGVAYSNANLTDSAARAVIQADPDAADLFEVLPAEADAEPTDSVTPASELQADPATTGLSDADLDKLADKVAERLRAGMKAVPAAPTNPAQHLGIDGQPITPGVDPTTETVKVEDTASPSTVETTTENLPTGPVTVTTGEVTNSDADTDADHDKPVRLSRMNKDQLVAAHLVEVGEVPADATNDELRQAIADARTAKA